VAVSTVPLCSGAERRAGGSVVELSLLLAEGMIGSWVPAPDPRDPSRGCVNSAKFLQ
jgi:hypothetical protein